MSIKPILTVIAVLILVSGITAITDFTFSGIVMPEDPCEFNPVETETGQTFSSTEEFTDYMKNNWEDIDRFESESQVDEWLNSLEYEVRTENDEDILYFKPDGTELDLMCQESDELEA